MLLRNKLKLCFPKINCPCELTLERVCLFVEGRGSRVTGRGSRVNSRGSRVYGRGSRVEGRGSRVEGRKIFDNVFERLRIKISCLLEFPVSVNINT